MLELEKTPILTIPKTQNH